jgi:predicted nucleic acid-binding protein
MPVLFDTTVYIRALQSEGALLLQHWAQATPLWLSAVVLEELYAGARPSDIRVVARLEAAFARAGRILVPNPSDWANAGKMLALLAKQYSGKWIGGPNGHRHALIAASAARAGVAVLTMNEAAFAPLSECCPLEWRVVAF